MATETTEAARSAQRNVYVFGATSLLNDTASEIAYWILPAFLLSIGAGAAKLGIIEGVAESVASIAKLFSGYLTDRFPRRKPLVVFGYTLANAVKPILAVATAWWQVLIIRFADRTSKGIRGAPRDVMLTESADPGRIGSAFGLLQAMDSAGAILGPAIALLLVGSIGYRGVFWVAAIPGVLAIILVTALARETGRGAPRKDRPILDFGPPAHLPPIFYFVLAAVTLFSIGNSSDMFLVLRAQDVGIPPTHAPLLGLVFNVVYTSASWPAGRFSDRASKPLIASAGYTVFAIVYLVFALAPSRSAIWAMMAFYGLFYALTNPVLRAMVAQTVAPESRGRAFGFYYFATSLAALFSSIATGELWKHFGPKLPFLISAALAAVSAAMLIAVHRRFEHPHPASS